MPRPFVTSLLKSGAKCYVLQPMGKAKIMHQKQILKVIDQWAADNKAKSIMISKSGSIIFFAPSYRSAPVLKLLS